MAIKICRRDNKLKSFKVGVTTGMKITLTINKKLERAKNVNFLRYRQMSEGPFPN